MKKILSVFAVSMLLFGCNDKKVEPVVEKPAVKSISGDLLTNVLDSNNQKNTAKNSDFVDQQNKDSNITLFGNFENGSKDEYKCTTEQFEHVFIGNDYFFNLPSSDAGGYLYKNKDGKCVVINNKKEELGVSAYTFINNKLYVISNDININNDNVEGKVKIFSIDDTTPTELAELKAYSPENNIDFASQMSSYNDILLISRINGKELEYYNTTSKESGTIKIDSKILGDKIVKTLNVVNDKLYLTIDSLIVDSNMLTDDATMYEFDLKVVMDKKSLDTPTFTYNKDQMGIVDGTYLYMGEDLYDLDFSKICYNQDFENCLKIEGNDEYDIHVTMNDSVNDDYIYVTLVNKKTALNTTYLYNIDNKSTYKLFERKGLAKKYDYEERLSLKGYVSNYNIIGDNLYARVYAKDDITSVYWQSNEDPIFVKLNLK